MRLRRAWVMLALAATAMFLCAGQSCARPGGDNGDGDDNGGITNDGLPVVIVDVELDGTWNDGQGESIVIAGGNPTVFPPYILDGQNHDEPEEYWGDGSVEEDGDVIVITISIFFVQSETELFREYRVAGESQNVMKGTVRKSIIGERELVTLTR